MTKEPANWLENWFAGAAKGASKPPCVQIEQRKRLLEKTETESSALLMHQVSIELHKEAAAAGKVCSVCGWDGEGIAPA